VQIGSKIYDCEEKKVPSSGSVIIFERTSTDKVKVVGVVDEGSFLRPVELVNVSQSQ
jgi:hypothetical protein